MGTTHLCHPHGPGDVSLQCWWTLQRFDREPVPRPEARASLELSGPGFFHPTLVAAIPGLSGPDPGLIFSVLWIGVIFIVIQIS